jgi:hypothetical protein
MSIDQIFGHYPWLQSELEIAGSVSRGATGTKVKQIQEWLNFAGFKIKVDSDFGPATMNAVCQFQNHNGLPVSGVVDYNTFSVLTQPLLSVLETPPFVCTTYNDEVKATATRHLAKHPIEIGGDNTGPWVRLYMQGQEGSAWYWCAGFVTFILKQAAYNLGIVPPLKSSFSCDELAQQAKNNQIFIDNTNGADRSPVKNTCSIFLVKKSENDWSHTGFSKSLESETFISIEGNSNDEGSRNGFEVCSKIRGIGSIDFIKI